MKPLLLLRNNTQSLELRLGKAQQWRRMLRGQELQRIPGFLGWTTGPENVWQLQEWRFDRFANRREDGQDYYYALGPDLSSLEDKEPFGAFGPFCGKPVKQVPELLQPEFLAALLHFLEALCQQYQKLGYRQQSVIWDGLLYQQEHNRFLLLPPEFTHFVAQRSPEEVRLQHVIPYQLPEPLSSQLPNGSNGGSNSQRWSYALGVLLFLKLCGELPFRVTVPKNQEGFQEGFQEESQEELLHDAVMAPYMNHYIRAQLFCPELSDSWDDFLQGILYAPQIDRAEVALPDLRHWQQALRSPENFVSLWRECSEEQRLQAASSLANERRRRKQSWQCQRFWRKKRSWLMLCLVLASAVSALIYTPLKRALSPPEHRNYSAYDTAMLYYQAIDRLDPQLHGQLSYKGNATVKADGNMLTMLYVNAQTRRSYEGRDVLLRAEDWLTAEGLSAQPGSSIPALSLDFVPYGISHISMDKGPVMKDLVDGATVTLKASYDIWFPGTLGKGINGEQINGERINGAGTERNSSAPLPQALQPMHWQNTDKIVLLYRARKQAWYVHSIQRSSREIQHPLP